MSSQWAVSRVYGLCGESGVEPKIPSSGLSSSRLRLLPVAAHVKR